MSPDGHIYSYRIHQNSVEWGSRNSNMFHAANNLRAVNMPERDVVGWRKVLCRKRVQRANIDVTHGITLLAPTVVKCPVAMMGRG